jgi:hypothetical protein
MNYKVVPVGKNVADRVRETMISPHSGLPAFSSVANGYGPCRSCLKTFRQGEEQRIYISYNPFAGVSDLPLPGPVFIHTDECEEYSENCFPNELLSIPLLFEGFGDNSRLIKTEKVNTARLYGQIEELLMIDDVKFIHIRNAEAGCFIAKIERAQA